MSLMLKHQRTAKTAPAETVAARKTAVIGAPAAGRIGRQQLAALLSNALAEDLKSLKEIHSIERKIAVKRELLIPKYRDYVARLRADGKQHDILGYYLVWLLDAGEMDSALELGFFLVGQGAGLPGERFSRDLPTFMADAVLEWAEAEFDAGRSPEPYFARLFKRVDGLADGVAFTPWDLPDALRAKYYRLRGLLDERLGDVDSAIRQLEKALSLGAKVKTKLGELAKLQARQEAAGNAAPPAAPPLDTRPGGQDDTD
jgi:tetratricopeptide (TPR) repeat protein